MSNNDKVLNQKYFMQLSDGSTWAVPVSTIAMHHAMSHALEDELMDYMYTKTLPLFIDPTNLMRWAKAQMSWEDVQADAVLIRPAPSKINFNQEWLDCKVIVK